MIKKQPKVQSFEDIASVEIMSHIDEVFPIAKDGIDLENFFKGTDLGQRMMGKLHEEVLSGILKFMRADPADTTEMRKIQTGLIAARKYLDWMNEVVNYGDIAEQEIIESEKNLN